MIVLRVEIWPGGDERNKRILAAAEIINQGERARKTKGEFADYSYQLREYRDDGSERFNREGSIENFPRRATGFWALLSRCLGHALARKRQTRSMFDQGGK